MINQMLTFPLKFFSKNGNKEIKRLGDTEEKRRLKFFSVKPQLHFSTTDSSSA